PVDLPALSARVAGQCTGRAVAGPAGRRAARRGPPAPHVGPRQSGTRTGTARHRRRGELLPMSGPADTGTPIPRLDVETIREFGPHLAYARDSRLDTGVEAETLVKTHCCFCGQQCGMQLKVKDNVVVGVEPWYEFPFNKGMMCPKGIKRYLQQAHPDRLLHAYEQ